MIYEIKKAGTIHEFDLIDMLDLSIHSYKVIKPWFRHRFEHVVQFDPKMKTWRYLPVNEEENGDSIKRENKTLD